MVRKRRSAKPNVAQLLQQAAALTPVELEELKAGIDALGAIEQAKQQVKASKYEVPEVDEHGKPSNQRGYVEEKMINGCGPYRYLRFWSGKKHRSVYLAKAQPDGKNSV
jgi:hypothetical protein